MLYASRKAFQYYKDHAKQQTITISVVFHNRTSRRVFYVHGCLPRAFNIIQRYLTEKRRPQHLSTELAIMPVSAPPPTPNNSPSLSSDNSLDAWERDVLNNTGLYIDEIVPTVSKLSTLPDITDKDLAQALERAIAWLMKDSIDVANTTVRQIRQKWEDHIDIKAGTECELRELLVECWIDVRKVIGVLHLTTDSYQRKKHVYAERFGV